MCLPMPPSWLELESSPFFAMQFKYIQDVGCWGESLISTPIRRQKGILVFDKVKEKILLTKQLIEEKAIYI